ncbi:UNVERIFIED_CONTAM: hypothetical protein H355_006889 [Colinus virginianus]|nr:hypothetical protein H355_006889 [Colinus virginianus]
MDANWFNAEHNKKKALQYNKQPQTTNRVDDAFVESLLFVCWCEQAISSCPLRFAGPLSLFVAVAMVQIKEPVRATGCPTQHRAEASDEKESSSQASCSQLTFTFTGEDHTLGNALRSILVRKPGVEFAGYSIPHPNQPEMNIRLQTTGQPAIRLLRESLEDLSNICDHLDFVYDEALDEFYEKREAATKSASSA